MKQRRLGRSLREAGKVRVVGCSNESCYGLMESLWKADALGSVRFETIQNAFSLLNRRFEDELKRACRQQQVALLAYSPLAGGVLSGKYQGGAWPEGARFSFYRDHSPRTQVMTGRFVSERTRPRSASPPWPASTTSRPPPSPSPGRWRGTSSARPWWAPRSPRSWTRPSPPRTCVSPTRRWPPATRSPARSATRWAERS